MSKYVKDLVAQDIRRRLEGVNDALLVNVVGIDSGKTYLLRKELRQKNIQLLVVKNSMARRATQGTRLEHAFDGTEGSLAVFYGGEDFISLVKEFVALDKSGKFDKLKSCGGVMDGEKLSPERVKDIAKWPNRQQQLGILLGQILSPGGKLLSQLTAPGGLLASQIKKKSEGAGESAEAGSAEAPVAAETGEASPEPPAAEPAS